MVFEGVGRGVAAACFDVYTWVRFVLSGGHDSVDRDVLADRELEALVGLYICEGFLIKSNSVSARRQASA
jgi:hypothetical protein